MNSHKNKFYIGPKWGLNYFRVNESGTQKASNDSETYEYNNLNYWDTNKTGIGLLLEYKRNILSDNISVFFSTEPRVIFYSNFGLMGSSDPVMVGSINFNLGFKLNIKK